MAGGLERWDRWKIGWQHTLFVVTLALSTVTALTEGHHGGAAVAVRLGPPAALAAWYAFWFAWVPARGGGRRAAKADPGGERRAGAGQAQLTYLVGAAILWAVAAGIDPALLPVGVAALLPFWIRRPLWAAAGVPVLVAAWLVPALVDGSLSWTAVLVCLLGVGAAVAVSGYITTLDRQSRARQQLLDRLAATQAELAAAERAAGIAAERQRLARDIHDTLTQGFTSIAMLLDAAQAHLSGDHPASRHVERAMAISRENLAESRRLVSALRPTPLDGARLPDAVRALTNRFADETGVHATAVVTGDVAVLSESVEAGLLRVVQEALTNIRRHAAATQVTVTLSYIDDTIAVDVQDDGIGFAAEARSGVGLSAMRDRINQLGGTLTVESAQGQGTTIAATVPRFAPPGGLGADHADLAARR